MVLEYDALDAQNRALGESWMSLHCATGVSLFTRHELPFSFLSFCFSRHAQQHMAAFWAVGACDMNCFLTWQMFVIAF